ncbi:hypothetical protein ACFWPK_27005 [Nocardia sp. NPDC058519]|uniref:hypothetical protein n=1 Tax=Nocardia sp. NPDC058519 TaxID=3346535 RepID=UPI00365F0D29
MEYSLQDLLSCSPLEIEDWVNGSEVSAGFNWLGLSEISGQEAVRGDVGNALVWARIGVSARGVLADLAVDSATKWLHSMKAMRLRAEMISRFRDNLVADPLLDYRSIFDWFISRHNGQFEKIAADADMWRELPLERIRELRRVKEELNVLRCLLDCVPLVPAEIRPWIGLWYRLP